MLVRPFEGKNPRLGDRVFVAENATLIGDVEIGNDVSIWFGAVLRGDMNFIRVGSRTNIQDNCVVHVFKVTYPTELADHVTVGHSVTLHGCRIDSYCLIGMGATILNGAHIGEESIVAAGTLIPEGMTIPPRSLVMGVPGKVRRETTGEEREGLRRYSTNYYEYKESYLAELQRNA